MLFIAQQVNPLTNKLKQDRLNEILMAGVQMTESPQKRGSDAFFPLVSEHGVSDQNGHKKNAVF